MHRLGSDGQARHVCAMPVTITPESVDQDSVRALLRASDAYAASLYPADSNHLLDLSALQGPSVTFLVARCDGAVVGCAALVAQGDGKAEIKRMFVAPETRGQGVGRMLLAKLESCASDAGINVLRLETGIRQPEAIALYRGAGFSQIGPFPPYGDDPNSVFMEKRLPIAQV
jgi:putative acetyltransferase